MSMAVELWAMQLERPLTAEETEVLTALLPSGRRARLERIWDAARRQEPLCAYFILRRAVWEQYHWQELPPLALTEKGKPYFPDIPAVHFSISHTDGAVLAALSAAPVGVDVERLRPVGERVMRRLANTQDPLGPTGSHDQTKWHGRGRLAAPGTGSGSGGVLPDAGSLSRLCGSGGL